MSPEQMFGIMLDFYGDCCNVRFSYAIGFGVMLDFVVVWCNVRFSWGLV